VKSAFKPINNMQLIWEAKANFHAINNDSKIHATTDMTANSHLICS